MPYIKMCVKILYVLNSYGCHSINNHTNRHTQMPDNKQMNKKTNDACVRLEWLSKIQANLLPSFPPPLSSLPPKKKRYSKTPIRFTECMMKCTHLRLMCFNFCVLRHCRKW